MRIIRFSSLMAKEAVKLFYDTVHTVCSADYTPVQCMAWAPSDIIPEEWVAPMLDTYALAAVDDGTLLGFGNIDINAGYLDRLYVSSSCQGRGIGKTLLLALEAKVSGTIHVDVSDTALGFFRHMNYSIVRENHVERRGVILRNWKMEKGGLNS